MKKSIAVSLLLNSVSSMNLQSLNKLKAEATSKTSIKVAAGYAEGCSGEGCSGYRGKLSTTKTGYSCKNWELNNDHKYKPSIHPELESNYCRNPDNSSSVWCYSNNPDDYWENCDVDAYV